MIKTLYKYASIFYICPFQYAEQPSWEAANILFYIIYLNQGLSDNL